MRKRSDGTVRKLRNQFEASGSQDLVLSTEPRRSTRQAAASQAADDARHAKSSHRATLGAALNREAPEESMQALLTEVFALEAGQQQLRAGFQQGQTDLQHARTELQQTSVTWQHRSWS